MADISLRIRVQDDGTVVVENFSKVLEKNLESITEKAKSSSDALKDIDDKLGGVKQAAERVNSPLTTLLGTVTGLNQGVQLLATGFGIVIRGFELGINVVQGLSRSLIGLGASIVQSTEDFEKFSLILESSLGEARGKEVARITKEISNISPLLESQVRSMVQSVALIPSLNLGFQVTGVEQVEKDLKKITNAIQGLATFRPDIGPEGALFAFREFLQGQTLSLEKRFDVDVDTLLPATGTSLSEFKSGSALERVEQFVKLSEFLVSAETQKKLSATPRLLFEGLQEFVDNFGTKVGQAGFYDRVKDTLNTAFDAVAEAFNEQGGSVEKLAGSVSSAMNRIFDASLDGIIKLSESIFDKILGSESKGKSFLEKALGSLDVLVRKFNDNALPVLEQFIEKGIVGLDKAIDALGSEEFLSFLKDAGKLMTEFVGLLRDLVENLVPKLKDFIEFARENPATAAGLVLGAAALPSAVGAVGGRAFSGAVAGAASNIGPSIAAGTSLAFGAQSLGAIASSGSIAIIVSAVGAVLAAGAAGVGIGLWVNKVIDERISRDQAQRIAGRDDFLRSASQDPSVLTSAIGDIRELSNLFEIVGDTDANVALQRASEGVRAFSVWGSKSERRVVSDINEILGRLRETNAFAFRELDFDGALDNPGKVADILRGVEIQLQEQLSTIIDVKVEQGILVVNTYREKLNEVVEKVRIGALVKIRDVLAFVSAARSVAEDKAIKGREDALINNFSNNIDFSGSLKQSGLDFVSNRSGQFQETFRKLFVKDFLGELEANLIGTSETKEGVDFPEEAKERVRQAAIALNRGLVTAISEAYVDTITKEFAGSGPREIEQILRNNQDDLSKIEAGILDSLRATAEFEKLQTDRSLSQSDFRLEELELLKIRETNLKDSITTYEEQIKVLERLGRGDKEQTKQFREILALRREQLAAALDREDILRQDEADSQGLTAISAGIRDTLKGFEDESPLNDLGKNATNIMRDSLTEGIVDGIKNGAANAEPIFKSFLRSIEAAVLETSAKIIATALTNAAIKGLTGIATSIASSFFGGSVGTVVGPAEFSTSNFTVDPSSYSFTGATGGILNGSFLPVKTFATGSPFIDRPTIGLLGEGAQSEAVVPLSNGRSIPVMNVGNQDKQGGAFAGMSKEEIKEMFSTTIVNSVDKDFIRQVVTENGGEIVWNVIGSDPVKLRILSGQTSN